MSGLTKDVPEAGLEAEMSTIAVATPAAVQHPTSISAILRWHTAAGEAVVPAPLLRPPIQRGAGWRPGGTGVVVALDHGEDSVGDAGFQHQIADGRPARRSCVVDHLQSLAFFSSMLWLSVRCN